MSDPPHLLILFHGYPRVDQYFYTNVLSTGGVVSGPQSDVGGDPSRGSVKGDHVLSFLFTVVCYSSQSSDKEIK